MSCVVTCHQLEDNDNYLSCAATRCAPFGRTSIASDLHAEMHGNKLTVHMQTQIQDILPTGILKKRNTAGSCLYSKFCAVVTVLLIHGPRDRKGGKGMQQLITWNLFGNGLLFILRTSWL